MSDRAGLVKSDPKGQTRHYTCVSRIGCEGVVSVLSEEQSYLFDTFGYIVVPNVLSQNQVELLRSTLKHPTEQFEPVAQTDNPLHWHPAWRDLLDLPALTPILEALVGNHAFRSAFLEAKGRAPYPTFRLDHINVHTHVKNGFPGAQLHGGWLNSGGSQFFRYHDGQFYNGLIAVSFELHDTFGNDGGFACIPGTHKSNVALPAHWRDLSQGVHESISRIAARAGDAIVFTEALTHGTLPWTVDDPRETVFYKFSPHGTTWSADFLNPSDFAHYEDMDARRMAILEAPNARYQGRPTQWRG